MSPSLTDQLSLPVDVFGKLLLLLPDEDIQRVRLVCQAWLAAVDHQMRVLQPLHLPQQPSTAVFSSCERVEAPVLRHASQTSTQHPDADFCWDAPIRHFNGMCVSMQHAAELDLSGQQLPPGCLRQLAQQMTRLRSLKLEASSLPTAAELYNLAAFAAQAAGSGGAAGGGGVSQLSLAGVQIKTSSAAGNVRMGQSPAAAALAAAAARLSGSSSSSSSVGVPEMLSAIATNPLTHLDLCRTAKVRLWGLMGCCLVTLPACTRSLDPQPPPCAQGCCKQPKLVWLNCQSDCLLPRPALCRCFLPTGRRAAHRSRAHLSSCTASRSTAAGTAADHATTLGAAGAGQVQSAGPVVRQPAEPEAYRQLLQCR